MRDETLPRIARALLLWALASPLAAAETARLVNVAPLASVEASARMDGAHDATNINDGDPETYWSAWPYTMRGNEDVITLDVDLPLPVAVHRVEMDAGYQAPEIRLSVRVGGQWREHDSAFDRSAAGPRFVWAEPVTLDALKFEYPGVRAANAGVVVHELRILAELPPAVEIASALSEGDTPDLDWERIATGLSMKRSAGGPRNSWCEVSLEPARPVHRVEMTWEGADYARRTVLELQCEDGRRLFVPRQRFSTSFTFREPYRASRVRLHCTQVGAQVGLSELRLLSGGKAPAPPADPQVAVWPESALVKVDRRAAGPHERSPFKRGDPLRIELARNEYEAGQIIVRNNGDRVLRDVSVVMEDLRRDDGAVLPAGTVAVNPVAWVNNVYPDVLLPAGAFKVAAKEVRPVWLTVHADAAVGPGIYRGQALCRCAGQIVGRLPVEVTVWDVTLPDRTHFKTHYFAIWGTDRFLRDAMRDPQRREQVMEQVADQFIRHRISPGRTFIMEDYEKQLAGLTWAEYLAGFDRWTQKLIDGGLPFVGVLQGPRHGMKGGPATEKEYWQSFEKHLDEKGWLDKFAVQVGDEPPPGNQRVTNRAKQFMEWTPKLRRQCAFSSFGKKGTRSWVPLINEFGIFYRTYAGEKLQDVIAFSHERTEAGDGVSWYIHHVLSVEETPYLPRVYLWLLWKHRIDGALLYGVSEWAHRDVDRWEDDFVIHGTGFKTWGVLLWPEQGGFLDSVRFEAVRDGIEDYELHLLLDAAIQAAVRRNPDDAAIARARCVLDDTDALFVALNADQAAQADGYRIRDRHSDSPILCTNAVPADLLSARRAIVQAILSLRQSATPDQATSRDPQGVVPDSCPSNNATFPATSRGLQPLTNDPASPLLNPGTRDSSFVKGQPARPIERPDAPPEWARQYTDGLKAWRDIIYYWLDRQHKDGTFGFGWGEDCEMIVGWPGVMMAADDRRVEHAIERLADNRWYNGNTQNGYVYLATEAEHGAEPSSYTQPVLLYQKFGSPKLIERLMVTGKNVEHWTAITPRGDRHMRSTYFGSQQLRDWPFYNEDSPINARTWLPMMHLLLYNRDPHLMTYYLEWMDSWARHAMEDFYGKPPGFLPGSVTFDTGEPGGHTKNWWGAGAHEFNTLWYHTRLHGMLVVAHVLTGEEKYITPLREMLRFLATYARPPVAEGDPLPPDRLPAQYTFPEGWRDGPASTRWARDVGWGHPGNWYYYVTGDTQFDEKFGKLFNEKIERGPFTRIDKRVVEQGYRRAQSFRDGYFTNVVPKLKYAGSLANYAAAWWQKQYGTMTFGQRCFRDGGRLANSVNWPWVDFPPPSVTWKDTGYTTAIFVLEDSPQRFRAALCNVAERERSIGAQFFTLDEGTYVLRLGRDADEDGVFDAVTRTDRIEVERGTIVRLELPPNVTTLFEMSRAPDSDPVPPWRSRSDLGLDPWDIMISKENPSAGDRVTVTVRVHNIGSQPAANVAVQLKGRTGDGETVLGEAVLATIGPPDKLVPSFADVLIEWTVAEGVELIGAVLDPADAIDELYEGNNAAWVRLDQAKTSQPVKEFKPHSPAVKPSLADVDPTDLSRYDVPFREGIRVDGVIGEQEWQGVEVFEFISHSPEAPPKKRTWMQIACDQDALFLALRCEEPDLDWLDTTLPTVTDIYYKDGFEIFLDPGAQVWRYWQFVFDTVPHKFQTRTRNQYAEKAPWEVAISKGDAEWSAEVRFPFSGFDVEPPKPGSRWRMNVMRFTTTFRDPANPGRQIAERSHFSPKGKLHDHHNARLFGDLYFKEK